MAKQDSFVSKVVELKRLTSSANGNPRFLVSFDNGETHQTSSDAGFCYGIENPDMRGYVRVWLTKSGRIADMKPITTADVERHVRALAEAEPDHVYRKTGDRCTNIATNGSEACLVGRAFVAAGIPDIELRAHYITATARGVIGGLHIPGDVEWLGLVQDHQDDKRPWGEAVSLADEARRLVAEVAAA